MLNGILESKRFWLAVASLAFVVLNERLGVPITEEQIQQVILVVAAWIVGDSLRPVLPKTVAKTVLIILTCSAVLGGRPAFADEIPQIARPIYQQSEPADCTFETQSACAPAKVGRATLQILAAPLQIAARSVAAPVAWLRINKPIRTAIRQRPIRKVAKGLSRVTLELAAAARPVNVVRRIKARCQGVRCSAN